MTIDKSKWNTNVKVSQKTIDEIKKMGMAKALKTVAGATAASKNDASARAWVEGVKRLYGSDRVNTAVKAGTPKKSGPMSANTPVKRSAPATSGPKSANTPAKSTRKVSTTSNPFTALHNALSPYGNKSQKFKSPFTHMTPEQVRAEMKRREAAAKKNK